MKPHLSHIWMAAIAALMLCPATVRAYSPLPDGPVSAQLRNHTVSLGIINSFKGVGLCMEVGSHDFHSVCVSADLVDIINGKASTPGFKTTYHYNLSIKEGKTRNGYPYTVYAGPGATFGYVRSLDNRLGFMTGVSGAAGARISVMHNISIALEFQGDAALIFKNRFNQNMSLYTAGFRYIYIPYVRISYCF